MAFKFLGERRIRLALGDRGCSVQHHGPAAGAGDAVVADVQAAAPDEPGEQGQRHVGVDASSDDAVDAEALLLATGPLALLERFVTVVDQPNAFRRGFQGPEVGVQWFAGTNETNTTA